MTKKERYIKWLQNGEIDKFNRYRQLLYRYNVNSMDLRRADLRNADLCRADLWRADLWRADLYKSNLRNAVLWRADLRNADLRSADLYDTNLYDADLKNADLKNADLKNAHLKNAHLRNADLCNIRGKHIYKTSGNGRVGRDIWYILEDDYIQAGCWSGSLKEFLKKVEETYGHDKKGYEYQSYQDVIEYYQKKKDRYDKGVSNEC